MIRILLFVSKKQKFVADEMSEEIHKMLQTFIKSLYRTQVYLGSNLWVRPGPFADLTDMTLS